MTPSKSSREDGETVQRSDLGGAWLDPALRRQAVYLHLQELVAGRDVVEVWSTVPHPRGAELLVARGARRVTVVAPRPDSAGRGDSKIGHSTGEPSQTGLPSACADVCFALEVRAAHLDATIAEARRVLRPDGVLVLGIPSKDRPQAGAGDGASYYDILDACGAFDRVRMVGMAPFAGTTLVEYGVRDPEPILDGTLVERGERVEHYIAVAGPERRGDFGYGVVQVPVEAVARVHAVASLRREQPRAGGAEPAPPASAPVPLAAAAPNVDKVVAELRKAIELHAGEMRAKEIELAERGAYIAELERDGRRVHELEGRVAAAEARREEAERQQRDLRRLLAEHEGRARHGGGAQPTPLAGGAPGDVEVLKRKLADAEAALWKQVQARGEAEAAAAEVRADSVRKLQDARKLAQVELVRAMEGATKQLVAARDDLARSEEQRRALKAELAALRASAPAAGQPSEEVDSAHRRELARAREEGEAATLAARAASARAVSDLEAARLAADHAAREAETRLRTLEDKLLGAERSLEEARRERAALEQSLTVERARAEALSVRLGAAGQAPDTRVAEAQARRQAETAEALAAQGTELTRVRAELLDTQRQLSVLERERPPRGEVDRLREELQQARAQLAESVLELQRRDGSMERTAAAAAHERARAERLVADERQALAERNDARARAADAQAKLAGVEAERERAESAARMAEAKAHKAENEVKEKRERIRQLKRDLEDAERRAEHGIRRARTLETVRARVQALETAVATEVTRVVALESSIRVGAG